MQTINLNLIPGGVMPVINLTQFDEGRQFALAIYDGANAVDLSTASLLISGRKQDETAFSYSQSDTVKGNYVITVNSNTVTIRNTLQMAAAFGDVLATLTIKRSASDESTLNFVIRVQENPLNGVDISETEIPGIIALAEEQVGQAEAWATGEIDGVPVPSDAPQYENSAEFWAGQAQQAAQGGLRWKGDCTFAQIPTTGMEVGDMWNITDAFTTDARFKEGAGKSVQDGTNIAWDGTYWDLLATGSPLALPTGGIAGQFIVKNSSTDQDASWGKGLYYFSTIAAAQAAISAGTLPNGATVLVDEVGGNGSSPAIANMSDVLLTSLADGQILRYDNASGKWENKAIDSAISTSSTNPVQNSTIAATLANGRISFGVDGNGNFGYKKDGADTVYPFSSGYTVKYIGFNAAKTTSELIGGYNISSMFSGFDLKKIKGIYGTIDAFNSSNVVVGQYTIYPYGDFTSRPYSATVYGFYEDADGNLWTISDLTYTCIRTSGGASVPSNCVYPYVTIYDDGSAIIKATSSAPSDITSIRVRLYFIF